MKRAECRMDTVTHNVATDTGEMIVTINVTARPVTASPDYVLLLVSLSFMKGINVILHKCTLLEEHKNIDIKSLFSDHYFSQFS